MNGDREGGEIIMQFPNKFKIIWWGILVGLLTYLVSQRFSSFMSGVSNATDILIFVIWIALLVAPLFQEVTFFGVKLKREIDDLRTEFRNQIFNLRSDIQNTIKMSTEISPQIQILTPPPDSKLPSIEQRIKPILQQVLKEQGIEKLVPTPEKQLAPDNAQYLFSVRYAIENELRRIWRHEKAEEAKRPTWGRKPIWGATSLWPKKFAEFEERKLSFNQIARDLADLGIISQELISIIRVVFNICSAAIHGWDISNAQVDFVRDVSPDLITSLKAIYSSED
jgi:hypothetical protein